MIKGEKHPDVLGLIALDALEGAEHACAEKHIGSCEECLHELGLLKGAAASLIPDGPAPAGVWARIKRALDERAGVSDTGAFRALPE